MAPYKTSYRARLNLSQGVNAVSVSHGSQEQDEELSKGFASRGSSITQSVHNDKSRSRNVVVNGGQIKASGGTRPLSGSVRKKSPKPEPDHGASETIPTLRGEAPVEGAETAEDLVLWPPPGETLPAGAAPEAKVPAYINSRLLPHQREGVRFLYMLYRENRGGIEGDDMGLGKTIMTIAFLAAILKKEGRPDYLKPPTKVERPVLIVTPTSVLSNWERELDDWGPFRVGTFGGKSKESVLSRAQRGELEICLASIAMLAQNIDDLREVDWDCVFVDEAHVLKNDSTQFYKAMSRIRTRRRFGLTGTVLQNKYKELWCIFHWAAENSLGSKKSFQEYYEHPLKLGQRIHAPLPLIQLARERQAELLRALRPHFLRRTKDETIAHAMHGKADNVIFCRMSPLQRSVYRRVLESPDFQLLVRLNEPCDCGSGEVRGNCCHTAAEDGILYHYLHGIGNPNPHKCPYCMTLPCLQILLKISNHLELMKPDPRDPPEKQEKDRAFAAMALGEDAHLIGGTEAESSFMGLSDTQHCGKMRALESLLEDWKAQGDKVLLFSHSVRMLNILERLVIRRGYSHLRLDGQTPQSIRQGLCDDFNQSQSRFVFLISTRAGGQGLNLVSANRVVIFDPSWNPSFDLQAQDRSFRYGQTRHVTVYRLMTAGSIEEIVYNRQIYKQQQFHTAMHGPGEKRLFEGVQDRKDMQGELFGISNLFQDLADKVFTSDVLEREERITQITEDLVAQAVARRASPNPSQTLPDGERDEHGLDELARLFQAEVAGDTGRGPGSEMPLPRSAPNTAHVPAGLRDAGVVYAHRNEMVVGTGARTGERAGASWAWNDAARLHGAPQVEVRDSGARRRLAEAGRRGDDQRGRARGRRTEDEEEIGGEEAGLEGEAEEATAGPSGVPSSRPPRRRPYQFVDANEEEVVGRRNRVVEAPNRGLNEDDLATLRVESGGEDSGPSEEAETNERPPKRARYGRPVGPGVDGAAGGLNQDDMATLRVTGDETSEPGGELSEPGDDDPTLRLSDGPRDTTDDVATLRMDGPGLSNLQEVYDTQKEANSEVRQTQSVGAAALVPASPVPPASILKRVVEPKEKREAATDREESQKQPDAKKKRKIELLLKEMARMRGETPQETHKWLTSKAVDGREKVALQKAAEQKLKQENRL